MARKPMSEEQKKKLSEQAKARAAAKKAQAQEVQSGPVASSVSDQEEATQKKDYADLRADLQEVRGEVRMIHESHPDVVESREALEAVDKAVYFMEKVIGALESK